MPLQIDSAQQSTYPGLDFGPMGPGKRSAEILASEPTPPGSHESEAKEVSTSDKESHGSHHGDRYPVTTVEFSRVETPFIIGIWILSASIAKIGMLITPTSFNFILQILVDKNFLSHICTIYICHSSHF